MDQARSTFLSSGGRHTVLIDLQPGLPRALADRRRFVQVFNNLPSNAQALTAGAADCLVKACSPTELAARVGAALHSATRPEPFTLGEPAVHCQERRVTVSGRPVELPATEYDLLRVLSVNAGRVVSCDYRRDQVWSGRKGGRVLARTHFAQFVIASEAWQSRWERSWLRQRGRRVTALLAMTNWVRMGGSANLLRNLVKNPAPRSAMTRRIRPGYATCARSATECQPPAKPDATANSGVRKRRPRQSQYARQCATASSRPD